MNATTLRLTREFSVQRDKVFRAWTDPEKLKKWFHVGEDWQTLVYHVDFRIGGTYRLGMQEADGKGPYVVKGIYKEIEPPERLVFTWQWEGEDSYETLITINLREKGKGTELELIHERFPTPEECEKHTHGWTGCLAQLEQFLKL